MPTAFFAHEPVRLSASYRPTPIEVETYAHLIAETEGIDSEPAERRLEEAELQLWVWRAENRQRSPRRRNASQSQLRPRD